jgi:hypothetical protein
MARGGTEICRLARWVGRVVAFRGGWMGDRVGGSVLRLGRERCSPGHDALISCALFVGRGEPYKQEEVAQE